MALRKTLEDLEGMLNECRGLLMYAWTAADDMYCAHADGCPDALRKNAIKALGGVELALGHLATAHAHLLVLSKER